MAEIVSRHQAMAEAMNAERELAASEAKESRPDNEVSAAARALRQAGLAKRQQQAVQRNDQPVETQQVEDELATDEDETATPVEGEETGAPVTDEGEPQIEAITINGKRTTAEEILREYVPKADYTRKTMALSEKERQFAAEAQARLQRLDSLVQAMQSDIGQKSDPSYWLQRAQEVGNDVAFSERLQWEAQATKLIQAENARKEEAQKIQWSQLAARDQDLAENYNTEWSDTAKRNKDYEAIAQYAFGEGYTHEELANAVHSRFIRSLDKARKYDELMKTGKLASKELVKKPPVQKPGARSPVSSVSAQTAQKALQRFDRNPTRENLMALERLATPPRVN